MATSKQPRPRADARLGRLPKVQRREQLLAAAREVFVESGYHAASMDEMAARAGVTKPVLYQHFASKRDLYLAILDEGAGLFLTGIRAALRSTDDNQQRVYATVRAYFKFIAHDDADYRLLFETDLGNLPEVARRTNRVADQGAHLVSEVIAEDTGLDRQHALLLAHGLLGMAQVAAQQWLRDGKRIPADEAAALVAGLGWQGISGHPLTRAQVARQTAEGAGTTLPTGTATPARRSRPKPRPAEGSAPGPQAQASAAKPTRRSTTDPTST